MAVLFVLELVLVHTVGVALVEILHGAKVRVHGGEGDAARIPVDERPGE